MQQDKHWWHMIAWHNVSHEPSCNMQHSLQ